MRRMHISSVKDCTLLFEGWQQPSEEGINKAVGQSTTESKEQSSPLAPTIIGTTGGRTAGPQKAPADQHHPNTQQNYNSTQLRPAEVDGHPSICAVLCLAISICTAEGEMICAVIKQTSVWAGRRRDISHIPTQCPHPPNHTALSLTTDLYGCRHRPATTATFISSMALYISTAAEVQKLLSIFCGIDLPIHCVVTLAPTNNHKIKKG